MTDVAAMYDAQERRELQAEMNLDRDVRQMLDNLYRLRLAMNPEAVKLATEIKQVAVDTKQSYRGRHLSVTVTRNPLTGKLEAEIRRRVP